MNIFLCGQKAFGAATYNMLKAEGFNVIGISSPYVSDRTGRNDRLRNCAINDGVAWMPSGTLTHFTLPANTDLIVAAHSHDFIGKKTRLRSRLGAIGYHPSLLPHHRGRDAVKWTIAMGDKVTGGSVYWLSETTDGGPLAAQEHVFVKPGDTPEELWRRELFPLGITLLKSVVNDLRNGKMVRLRQDLSIGSWEPSMERAPLIRPDVELLGAYLGEFTVVAKREHELEIGGYSNAR